MNSKEYTQILEGHKKFNILENGRLIAEEFISKSLILSGSFNPLHNGHIKLLEAAKNMTKLEPFFEISISNVDKRNISLEDLNSRISQFYNIGKILITNSATFEDKSNLFKKSIFAIGYDTAVRILDNKYYEKDIKESLSNIKKNECSFLVTGRKINGKYKYLNDLEIEYHKGLFSIIPEENFRLDISSTEIRDKL
ncbi:MAG: hypothetical protein CL906_03935 [Dehalococcoidia bacterium]|nr:hypothetical protein [Dehalococcoidia bacterium]